MLETRYEAPETIDQAVAILGAAEPGAAKVLAGGTDLLAQLNAGARAVGTIVNVKKIPELVAITIDDTGLRLGAATPAVNISERAELADLFPGLAEATALIGSDQIQGRCSVGGNLCNGSPAADTVPSLLALGADCVIAGPGGRRTVPARDFVTAPGQTVLGPGELLVELAIPAPPAHSADAYLRLIPRTEMDIAVVGAAVKLVLDGEGTVTEAAVALGAVAPTAILVPEAAAKLVGTKVDEAALDEAARAASAATHPIDDKRGTAEYRSKVAGVLTKRAARKAYERAQRR